MSCADCNTFAIAVNAAVPWLTLSAVFTFFICILYLHVKGCPLRVYVALWFVLYVLVFLCLFIFISDVKFLPQDMISIHI